MAIDPLSGVPGFSFYRERMISPEVNPSAKIKAETGPLVPRSLVEDLFAQMDGIVYKADTLLAEIKRTARPFVPVHERAAEVRLALRTLYPGASEDQITFDQYVAAIEFQHRSAQIDPIKINAALTGDDKIDSRILSEETLAQGVGKDPKEMALIVGQFILLAVCNRMLQSFQAPNTQQAVAGKMPPATEIGATLAQMAIGLAAILLQTATTRQEAKAVLEESFSEALSSLGTTSDAVLDQAAEQEPDALLNKYQTGQTAVHQENIREYSLNYAMKSPEPGYEPWIAADEAHDIRGEIQTSRKEGENYLSSLSAPYTMSQEVYKLLACRNSGANDRLNLIAAVLSSKYTRDLLCCLVRIIGNIPTSQLQQLRWLLRIFANGISMDLGAAYNAAANSINAQLEQSILEPILHAVDNYFRDTTDLVAEIIDPSKYSDPNVFETLLVCTPFDEMLTYVVSALERVQALIVRLLRKQWNKIQLKNKYGGAKIKILGDNKRARMLLSVVDQVIAAVDKGNLCAKTDDQTLSPEDVGDAVDQIEKGQPAAIHVETDGQDPYKSFSSKALLEAQTSMEIPILRQPETKDGQPESGLRDCARAKIDDKVSSEFRRRAEALNKEMRDVNLE